MTEDNKNMIAVCIMALSEMNNDVVCAAHMVFTGFEELSVQNLAYQPLLEKGLIKESGSPAFDVDIITSALSVIINNRVKDGTFR